jgi:STE24 endopeptidase
MHSNVCSVDRRLITLYQISQSIFFVFILAFVSTLPDLPVGLYQTFILEEQHGFNKTTLSTFFTDILKSWALTIVIGTPALAAFLSIFEWAGDRFVPWVMILL